MVQVRFANEQKDLGELLEEKIIKNLIKQLQLYIDPLDYELWEKIIKFLDNLKTKWQKSKTTRVAIMRCIRRRLKIVLEPIQYIFKIYQDDNILRQLIKDYSNRYDYCDNIALGYWSLFKLFEHYRFFWRWSGKSSYKLKELSEN